MSARVAVVGAGGIGGAHLDAYTRAGADVVAVVDVDKDRATERAAAVGAVGYTELQVMLQETRPDAISICTPPADHAGAAIAALQAGVAVLCEKPMALTPQDCAAMIAAAGESGALLSVGFCHRFQPEIEAIRDALADGLIGTPLAYRNRFAGPLDGVENSWFSDPAIAGGGVLMDTCVHSVDLFRHLIGEVERVRAVTATTATNRGPAVAVEDSAVLAIQSTGGVVGTIEASWRTAPGEAVVMIVGSDGRIDFDYSTGALTHTTADGESSAMSAAGEDRFVGQARHFLACLAGAEQLRVTGQDGARAAEVLAEAYADATMISSR